MIKNKVVKELVQFTQSEFPVTSAYFSTDIRSGNHRTHLVKLKKMIRYKKNTTYYKQLKEAEQESVLADYARILDWFEHEFDTSRYISSICFSQTGTGFWKTMNLKIPLENELVIQPKPYIYQLSKLFSSYSRYGVVLIDKSKARVFEQSLGDFKELYSIFDNAPESVKVGGYRGRQERKVERNIHHGVIHHYKEIAQKIFDLNKIHAFDWMVLGGRKDVVGEFRKYLHDYVESKIAGEVEVEPNLPLNDVFKSVRAVGKQARLNFEKRLLENYHDQKEAGQAIEGIEAILSKIRENWVGTLLIQENYQQKGVFCRECDFVALAPLAQCPVNGGPVERTHNIIEHVLHLSLQQSVNVQYIQHSMQEYGNIAAILRYPIQV